MEAIRTIKYNPAFLSQEELIQSFVVRNTDLNLILETIQENREQANQHLLVVGPRGTGKTTLALRVAAEVRKNEEFSKLWYPIVFSEESYDVCSPGEFWLETLFHIGKHTKDKRWKKAHQELRLEMNESRLRDRALAQIMDFADEQGKRLLLIVENLNMILGQQISQDAAWKIRHTLINEPRIMLYGTAANRFEQIENGEKAMFELFKIHELQPLNSDECRTLWESITGQELKGDRIRPVQILTGGSPRLLVIISVFAAKASFNELMFDLTHLVDEHTEYFKSHIDNLPPLERKVFVTLADLWQPSTAREVGQAARMDVNKASAYLKRLISKGAVMEVEQKSGRKWYQLAERMYNIYHLMRRRGEPSSRVRAVVDFMVNFYSDEDLVKTVSSIAEEACGINPESRSDHYQALIEILKNPQIEKYRKEIIDNMPKKLFDSPNLPKPLKELSSLKTIPSAEHASITEEELASVMPNNSDDPNAWINLGVTLENRLERLDDAERAYREAIKIAPNNLSALVKLAFVLERKGNFIESEKTCKKILDIDSDLPLIWSFYGYLLTFSLKRYEKAEEALRKAIDIDPDDANTWDVLGFILANHLNRYDEAEQAFQKAIEIAPNDEYIWKNFGDLLLNHLNRYEEAEQAYRKAIEINPDNASAWNNLGELYSEQLKRDEAAEQAYRKAIEIDPGNVIYWTDLGAHLYDNLRRYNESEEIFRKAVDLDHDFIWALGGLGFVLDDLKKYEEAEIYYKKVLDISHEDSIILTRLGNLYRKTLRFEEAEQAYLKALDIDPSSMGCWKTLVSLQIDDLNSPEKALRTAHTGIEKSDRSPEMLNALAISFYRNEWNDYLDTAEVWCREAVEKEPENKEYVLTLAYILGAMNKWDEALELSTEFLQNNEFVSENNRNITSFIIDSAVEGYAQESLKIIEQSNVRKIMEPLITGLKLFLGEKVRAPQEVMEIGKDVVKRIKEKMEEQSKKLNK